MALLAPWLYPRAFWQVVNLMSFSMALPSWHTLLTCWTVRWWSHFASGRTELELWPHLHANPSGLDTTDAIWHRFWITPAFYNWSLFDHTNPWNDETVHACSGREDSSSCYRRYRSDKHRCHLYPCCVCVPSAASGCDSQPSWLFCLCHCTTVWCYWRNTFPYSRSSRVFRWHQVVAAMQCYHGPHLMAVY